jgi:hypothetical protein
MKAVAFILVFLFSTSALAQDATCEELIKAEKQLSAVLPKQTDEITTLVEVAVNCTTRILKYVKHLSLSTDQLASGAVERKQRQHTNLHCNSQGLARIYGWTVVDFVYDNEITLIMKLETRPSMCQ